MKKSKEYPQTRFSADVIREAIRVFREQTGEMEREERELYLHVSVGDEEWRHDSEEEFFADYRKASGGAVN